MKNVNMMTPKKMTKKRKMSATGFMLVMSTLAFNAQAASDDGHRGGNGGDIYEMDLNKRVKKIGKFINSTTGKEIFSTLNTLAVEEMALEADVNLTSDKVFDQFGAERTCINLTTTSTIACTSSKLQAYSASIVDGMLAHELFGLLGIETGYSDNPSSYPLSQKVMNYTSVIDSIMLNEEDIYPEYVGLDNQSYGITFVNKGTGETLRMICLNDNVTVNRCKNFSVVRMAQGMQSPLMVEKVVVTPSELKQIVLTGLKASDVEAAKAKIVKIQADGFDFLTIAKNQESVCRGYLFGAGAIQTLTDSLYDHGLGGCEYFWLTIVGIIVPVYNFPYLGGVLVDVPSEIAKQALNVAIYPIKAVASAFRLAKASSVVAKYNKRLERVRGLLNLKNDLSLTNHSIKIDDAKYQDLVNDTVNALGSIE